MSGSNTIVVIGRVEYPDEASHDHLRLIHTNKEEGTFWCPLLFGARDGTRLHLRFAQIEELRPSSRAQATVHWTGRRFVMDGFTIRFVGAIIDRPHCTAGF